MRATLIASILLSIVACGSVSAQSFGFLSYGKQGRYYASFNTSRYFIFWKRMIKSGQDIVGEGEIGISEDEGRTFGPKMKFIAVCASAGGNPTGIRYEGPNGYWTAVAPDKEPSIRPETETYALWSVSCWDNFGRMCTVCCSPKEFRDCPLGYRLR